MKKAMALLSVWAFLLACGAPKMGSAGPGPAGCSEPVGRSDEEWMPMKSPTMGGRPPLFSEEMTEKKRAMLDALEANRKLWRSHRICNYTITLQETNCYGFGALDYGPILNTVRDGRLVWAIYVGEPWGDYTYGATVKGKTALKKTVEQLFNDALQTIRHSTDNAITQVEYEPHYGYPTVIAFDNPDWHHDEARVMVTYFKPELEPQ